MEAVCEIVADPAGAIVTVLPEVATSQLIESDQVTVNVLVPVLVTVTPSTWFGPPTVPVYASEAGETLKPLVEVDCVMVSVTGSVLVVAPVAATVMVALKVPAANPVVFTLAVTVPLLVPDTGLRVNHAALSLAVQDKVPPPTFETTMDCAEGFVPPTVPAKPRLVVLSPMAGVEVAAVSARVIGNCLVTPPPEIVPVPLYEPAARFAKEAVTVKVPACPG